MCIVSALMLSSLRLAVFYKSNTHMLLGDAKAMCEQLKHQVAEKYGTKA
jgi:NAD/NADP transhydrogenase beta subunit